MRTEILERHGISEVKELLEGCELVGEYTSTSSWMDLLSGIDGVTCSEYFGQDDDYKFVMTNHLFKRDRGDTVSISVLLGSKGDKEGKYKYLEYIRDDAGIREEIEVRKGGFKKALRDLGISSEEMKDFMTDYKAGNKKYRVWESNDIFAHYNLMESRNIATSCMSHDISNYRIKIDGYRCNPLITLELDGDWCVLLLEEVKENRKEWEYPFSARALAENSVLGRYNYECTYGNSRTFGKILFDNDVFKDNSIHYQSIRALHNDDDQLILPYIDGSDGWELDGNVVNLDGYNSFQTSGIVEDDQCHVYCEYCEESHPDDEEMYVVNGVVSCERAIGHTIGVLDDGSAHDIDDVVQIGVYNNFVLVDDAMYCDGCQEYHRNTDVDMFEVESHNEWFCSDHIGHIIEEDKDGKMQMMYAGD